MSVVTVAASNPERANFRQKPLQVLHRLEWPGECSSCSLRAQSERQVQVGEKRGTKQVERKRRKNSFHLTFISQEKESLGSEREKVRVQNGLA